MSNSQNEGPSNNAWQTSLTDSYIVEHRGKLVAFARQDAVDTDALFFSVLDPDAAADQDDESAWNGWYRYNLSTAANPTPQNPQQKLRGNPRQLRIAGMQLLTMGPAATQAAPADASFEVVSAGQYLLVFRPSKHGSLYVDQLVLTESKVQTSDKETETRFALSRAWEMRFQRSGIREVPLDDTDSRGLRDPAGAPFLKPTIELTDISDAAEGHFSVVRVSTSQDNPDIWYIAVVAGDRVRLFSIIQDDSPGFDFDGAGANCQTLSASLVGSGTALSPKPMAPALTFWAEQEPHTGTSGAQSEVERAGRLMLAFAASADGLDPSTVVYDFGMNDDGMIPKLPADQQAVVLADGTYDADTGVFEPDKDATSYPPAGKLARSIRMVDGLKVSAIALGQVKPNGAPTLRTGEDGFIHLYHGGPEPTPAELRTTWGALAEGVPQAMVAQFDTKVSRLVIELPWTQPTPSEQPPGVANMVAKMSGCLMEGAEINVTDPSGSAASQADLCDLNITYPDSLGWPDETWRALPRQVDRFQAVLNGAASDDSADNAVLSGERQYYTYGGDRPIVRVPLGRMAESSSDRSAADELSASHLTVVPTRSDFPVKSAQVVRSGDAASGVDVVLSFGAPDGQSTVKLVWSALPEAAQNYPEIFSGNAPPSVYAYSPGEGTTALFALNTDSPKLPAPLLFYAKPSATDPGELTIAVTPASDQSGALDVTFDLAGQSTVIDNVPADVDKFVETLEADDQFRALGLGLSAQGVAGNICPDAAEGPLNLAGAAALFDMLSPHTGVERQSMKPGTFPAIQQGHAFSGDDASQWDTTRMVGFHVTVVRPDDGAPAYVDNTGEEDLRQTTTRRGELGRRAERAEGGLWRRKAPEFELSFDGADRMSVPVARSGELVPTAESLTPQWDWTLEAWLKPSSSERQRVLTFHDAITDTPGADPLRDYRVAIDGAGVLAFEPVEAGRSSYFQTGSSSEVDFYPDKEFTWEFWVKPEAQAAPSGSGTPAPLGGVVQLRNDRRGYLAIGLDAERHVVVRTHDDRGDVHDLVSNAVLTPVGADSDTPSWNHVAVIGRYDADAETWSLAIAVDGVHDASASGVELMSRSRDYLIIGRNSRNGASVFGRIAQLRYWKAARPISEIRNSWLRNLTGQEASLLGCWHLAKIDTQKDGPGEGDQFVRNIATPAGKAWDAKLQSDRQDAHIIEDSFMLSLVATVGGLPSREIPAVMTSDRWNHFALVYKRGGGLRLNTPQRLDLGYLDWAVCEDSADLGGGSEFAVDAWVQVGASMTTPGTIIARWADDQNAEDRSYRLAIDEHGEVVFEVCLTVSSTGEVRTEKVTSHGANLDDGTPHHIGARFKTWDTSTDDNTRAKYLLEIYDAAKPEPIGSTDGEVDGITVAPVVTASIPVSVGRSNLEPAGAPAPDPSAMNLFEGTMGRLRYWSTYADRRDLFPEQFPRIPKMNSPKGLISEWEFRDQSGRIARDRIGGNDLKLTSSAPWASFETTSELDFVINGATAGTSYSVDEELVEATQSQFCLGKPLEDGVPGFDGALARVAMWGEAHSEELIRARRFKPLVGDEKELLAAWDFTQQKGLDITGGGNDAEPAPDSSRFSASNAPISNEGPTIRNVYGERVNEYHRSATGRIAVGTYGDAEHTENGPQAYLERALILDPNHAFPTSLYIGRLDLTYIGQVQTDPTLIGYIEGAPPVPSENLTRPYYVNPVSGPYMRYLDTSMVTLAQQAANELSFGASLKTSNTIDLSVAAGVYWAYKIGTVAGFVFSDTIQAQSAFQGVFKMDEAKGTTEEDGFDAQWIRAQTDSMGLSGDWEPFQKDQANYLNPTVGRRFVADNFGSALVESLTADLYAMTYHANGAALGTIVLPNPSIPPDRNLLIFPIDDSYTRAGTLDGRVGLVDDPAYENRDKRDASYFKPAQAYELARQIEDRAEEARAQIEAFDAQGRGEAKKRDLDDPVAALPVDFEAEPANGGQLATPGQGIVTRNVWTAGGGLHTERQSYAASATRKYSGFNHFAVGGGIHGEVQAPVFKGSLDVLGQHVVDVSVSRQSTDKQALEMQIDVEGEAYLRAWDCDAPADYGDGTGAYRTGVAPGKVLAYRFMSFYEPPDTRHSTHFESVVDPQWKRLSNDPTARAMRELDTSNAVWRVSHRVTYVEREPPKTASRPDYSPAASKRIPINMAANRELLVLIDRALGEVSAPTPVEIGQAVAKVINPPPKDGSYPKAVLEEYISWWSDFLDSARPDGDGEPQDLEAARQLATLMRRVLNYCVDAYATGTIERHLADRDWKTTALAN